jgi:hypothetical protein
MAGVLGIFSSALHKCAAARGGEVECAAEEVGFQPVSTPPTRSKEGVYAVEEEGF